MVTRLTPQLVTIEGESYNPEEVAEMMGIDPADSWIFRGNLTPSQREYVEMKYPELMGILPILAKVGALVAKGAKGIVSAVKARRAKKSAAATAAAQQKAAIEAQAAAERRQQQLILAQQQQAAEQQKKTMMMIALPLLAVAALMALRR